MGCSGIYEEAVAHLANISQSLHSGCIEGEQRGRIDPDVVPEWIADNFGSG
jgi:hypothetical protein